jgi:ERCC4-type nuclease
MAPREGKYYKEFDNMINAIIIDTREPKWVQELKFGGLPTTVQFLDHGDLMAATDEGELLLIERKTPSDFLNSLKDGRLFLQLSLMLNVTRWSYLMITGELKRGSNGQVIIDRFTGWDWNAVQGALVSIQELGIFVVFCNGDDDFEPAILRLGRRDRSTVANIPPAKRPHILNVSESIIASLPGIGIERLKTVMDYANGQAAWAISGLTDPDTQYPGVPHTVKGRIRRALNLKDNEILHVITCDNGSKPAL